MDTYTLAGSRAETTFTYDSSGRLKTIADPLGNVTENFYDSRGRIVKTAYADGTNERTFYGTSGNGIGLPVKTIDRSNIVTNYTYDGADRRISRTVAAAIDDGSGTETATPNTSLTETWEYLTGTDKVIAHTQAGSRTEYVYNGRGYMVKQTVIPRSGKELTTKRSYVDNKLFSTEDPYGRKQYFAYDSTDGRQIRTVDGTTPSYSLADYAAVLSATRSGSANSSFTIHDNIFDADGNLIDSIDGRGTITRAAYDERGRQVSQRHAFGTALEVLRAELWSHL